MKSDQFYINHAGEKEWQGRNSVSVPIFQASNFHFDTVDELGAALGDEYHKSVYTRGNNPTVRVLRTKLAALDRAEDSLVFASGSAAANAAIMSRVGAGDHIVSVRSIYGWSANMISKSLARFGVESTFIDGRDIENFKSAIQDNTTLIYLESPNSFLLELQDLKAVANLAQSKGIYTIIDNTYAGPSYQRTLDLGIDMVVYSASKYVSGHSDVVAGVLSGNKGDIEAIFHGEFMTLGACIGPQEAALLLRGLRTLGLRQKAISTHALDIAQRLAQHPMICNVRHPFLDSHDQCQLAKKQMRACGGLFTFELNTDIDGVKRFCDSLELFALAVSWGGHESVIIPSLVLGQKSNTDDKDIPHNIIRIYCGLDEPNELWADIQQALEKAKADH